MMNKQRINDETIREYRGDEQKVIEPCKNPTACWKEILTDKNDFVNLKNIFKICKCANRDICEEFLRTGDIKVLDKIA